MKKTQIRAVGNVSLGDRSLCAGFATHSLLSERDAPLGQRQK